jgi:hypothetical protein
MATPLKKSTAKQRPPGISLASERARIAEARTNFRKATYLFGVAFANITKYELWRDAEERYHSAQEMFSKEIAEYSWTELERFADVVDEIPEPERRSKPTV